jgi:hypothetical protein
MTVREQKELYQKDKKQFLNLYSEGTNFKIKTAEFYDSDENFKILENSIDEYFKPEGKYYFPGMTIEKEIMRSIVVNPDSAVLKIHDSITIFLPEGSHIRFSPYKEASIEITRVLVDHGRRGIGVGSFLMMMVMNFIGRTLGYTPKMHLECTGSVGLDPLNTTTISLQTTFFRKHGFKVNNRKHYPRFVTMTRPKQDYIGL